MKKNKEQACPVRKTSIGGQALMEGIMMRGPQKTAMAVRNPQGEIVLEIFPTQAKQRPAICRVPVIRGVVGFIDSMTFGYKCLMRSAEISGLEELEAEMEREKAAKKAAKQAAKKGDKQTAEHACGEIAEAEKTLAGAGGDVAAETATAEMAGAESETDAGEVQDVREATAGKGTQAGANKKKSGSSPMMTVVTIISVVFALAIVVGLFILFPTWLYTFLAEHNVPPFDPENRYFMSAFEGLLKVILLVGYMSLMLCMKDIRRTFRFHGAEHKTIFCYEHGLELTVENIRKERRYHPRCGTSFLILMVLVSIFIGFLIPPAVPKLVRMGIRLLLIPVIMGLGYELIKLCGRHDNWLTRLISLPGVWLQHITVLEPDDGMIECAIAAMKEVIPSDESDKW